MNKKMNPVVHFEFPATDRTRVREFYEKVFGWQTNQLGEDMGNYITVTTSESDEKTGFPKKPGTINGGIYQKMDDPISNYPSLVISVDDIQESVKLVESSGGKIHGQVQNIPGIGQYASFIDTEGNRMGILQPEPMK